MHVESMQHTAGISDARLAKQLGVRIAEARKIRGMKARTLADASGCSESLISRIENGKTIPSLQVLNRVIKSLNVCMSWVFEGLDDPSAQNSPNRSNSSIHSRNHAIEIERLSAPDVGVKLQCHRLNIEAGDESEVFQLLEGGEAGYLLEGSIELTVDGRLHRLGIGDAFVLKTDQSYRFRNVASGPASLLFIGTGSMIRKVRLFSAEARRARPWIFASPRSEMAFRVGTRSMMEDLTTSVATECAQRRPDPANS